MTNSISAASIDVPDISKKASQPSSANSIRPFTRSAKKSAPETPDSKTADAGRFVRNHDAMPQDAKRTENTHSRIPAPSRSDSPQLNLLRRNADDLINSMRTPGRPMQPSEISFTTYNNARGHASLGSDGMLTLTVDGEKKLQLFNDSRGATHILMKGPDDRMHAGRNLPENYVKEANSLVGDALYEMV